MSEGAETQRCTHNPDTLHLTDYKLKAYTDGCAVVLSLVKQKKKEYLHYNGSHADCVHVM